MIVQSVAELSLRYAPALRQNLRHLAACPQVHGVPLVLANDMASGLTAAALATNSLTWLSNTRRACHIPDGVCMQIMQGLKDSWKAMHVTVTAKDPEHMQGLLHLIPEDHLLIETDSPYLVPRTIK